jgi:hypothetical protein
MSATSTPLPENPQWKKMPLREFYLSYNVTHRDIVGVTFHGLPHTVFVCKLDQLASLCDEKSASHHTRIGFGVEALDISSSFDRALLQSAPQPLVVPRLDYIHVRGWECSGCDHATLNSARELPAPVNYFSLLAAARAADFYCEATKGNVLPLAAPFSSIIPHAVSNLTTHQVMIDFTSIPDVQQNVRAFSDLVYNIAGSLPSNADIRVRIPADSDFFISRLPETVRIVS